MDLINRDDLHVELIYPRRYDKSQFSEAVAKVVEMIIKNAPRVDAEPVRHGTWKESKIKTGGQISLSIPCYLCSECGGYMDASPLIFKYCPYCGAKMDGKKNEKA